MAPFVRISIHKEPVVVDEMLMPITVENRIGTSLPLLHVGRRKIYMRIHIFYPAICHNAIEMVPGIMRNHARGRRSHQLILLEVIDHQAGMTRHSLIPTMQKRHVTIVVRELCMSYKVHFVIHRRLMLKF